MDALFLSKRDIQPLPGSEPHDEGHGIMRDPGGWWYHTKYPYRAWMGLTDEESELGTLQPVIDRCQLIVIYIGVDGIDTLRRLVNCGVNWTGKKLIFITADYSLDARRRFLAAHFPGADCILSGGGTRDEVDEHLTEFLQTGANPRERFEHHIQWLQRRLDPFRTKTVT
jgi:hypothetical protein